MLSLRNRVYSMIVVSCKYVCTVQAFWSFSSAVLQVVPALALHEITQFMSDYVPNSGKKVPLTVILCVAGLFFSQVSVSRLIHHYYYMCYV
jgi:hypothetical protein